jgi:hypothetical protein
MLVIKDNHPQVISMFIGFYELSPNEEFHGDKSEKGVK